MPQNSPITRDSPRLQAPDPQALPEPQPLRNEKAASQHLSQLQDLTADPEYLALPVQDRTQVLIKYMQQLGVTPRQFQEDQERLEKSYTEEHGGVYRGLAGVGRSLQGLTSGLYHNFADEPTKAEGGKNAYPMNARVTLGLKRTLADPMDRLAARSEERRKRGDEAGSKADRRLASVPLLGPMANAAAERAGQGDVSGAVTETATPFLLPSALKGTKALARAGLESYTRSFRPITLDIEGVKVPMLKSEAMPETSAGKLVRDFKRAGVGEKHFENFAKAQQQAVKAVIRKVAGKTSSAISPMPESAAGSLSTAADAVEATAKPMYQALDASLTSVPSMLDATAKVVQKAMADAEKMGVSVGDLDPAKSPTTPFAIYQTLRSRLLQHARSASDPAVRAEIFRHVDTADAAIERGFASKPQLLENWKEANRLWRKMYALREVAQAVDAATKGSPEAVQQALATKGVSPVAPEMQGAQMVKRLNELADRSHGPSFLDRAFDETPEGRAHAMSVRQVAEVLNRAEQAGSSNVMASATKYSLFWKLLKKIGGGRLAQAMTTPAGAKAMADLMKAQTPLAQARTVVRHSTDLEDAMEEARRGGPGEPSEVEVAEKTRASVSAFAKQARNRAGKASGAPADSEAPPASSEEAGGSGSAAGAASDTSDFQQAKANLPQGTMSEWLREAQRIKDARKEGSK